MSSDISERIHVQKAYGRQSLLEYAKAKGVIFKKITRKKPSREEVLAKVLSKEKNAVNELLEILKLRRGLKLWTLTEKSKELGIYDVTLKRQALAVRIYCEDPEALRDLQLYQRTEPRQSTLAFIAKKSIPADKLCDEDTLRDIVEERLTLSEDAIATLDKLTRVGDNIRYVINFDNKKRTVERNPSVKFPGRKGTHDDYPLKRVVATYDLKSKVLRVSALKGKAEQVVRSLSEALTGKEDFFEEDKPAMDKAPLLFTDKVLRDSIQEENFKVVDIVLLKLPLEGGVSRLHLEGDDLVETIAQFDKVGIPLIGQNLSEIALLTLMYNKKRLTLDFIRGNTKTVGKFSEDELAKIGDILKRWGIYQKIY
jgi:hypothetical protein